MIKIIFLNSAAAASSATLSLGATIGYAVGLSVAVAIIVGLVITVIKLKKNARILPRRKKYVDEPPTHSAVPERQIEGKFDLGYLGVIGNEKRADLFKEQAMYP